MENKIKLKDRFNDIKKKTIGRLSQKQKSIILYSLLGVLTVLLIVAIFATEAYKTEKKEDITETTTEVIIKETQADEDNSIKAEADDSEITTLIKNYYQAKQTVDMESLELYVDNMENIKQEILEKESRYIEEYRNIVCYVIGEPDENSKVILVDVEYKFFNIDTAAPCPVYIYIKKGNDGKYYVHNMSTDDEVNIYISNLIATEQVKELENKINEEFVAACESDSELKHIWELVNE